MQKKSHLLALSRVSRKFRVHIFPRLFEVLTIQPDDEIFLWDLGWNPYLAQARIATVPNVLTAVKELRFSAPFEHTDFRGIEALKRCPHSFTQDSSASSIDSRQSEEDWHVSQEDDGAVIRRREDAKDMEELLDREHGDHELMKLASQIARLLSTLPDNQLISFR